MDKRSLEKRKEEICFEMVEANTHNYYELQAELEDIELELIILEELGEVQMIEIENYDSEILGTTDEIEVYNG